MAGTPIPFPVTALPGRAHIYGRGNQSSQGDLLNVYANQVGDEIVWRRTPGLTRVTPRSIDPSSRIPRGLHVAGSYLIAAWSGGVEAIAPGGAITPISGVVTGVDPVTMATNMRDVSQTAIVTQAGAYLLNVATMTVVEYPDTEVSPGVFVDNLGVVNSVDYYAGYFIFTRANGDIVASDLQNAEIPDLSYDKASYASDGLLRAVSNGETILLCGNRTIEVWQDVGRSPFPLQRATVLDVGIAGSNAIAGGANVWERGILFVASDFTVRQLQGYNPVVVSTPPVEHDIYHARQEAGALMAQVYTFMGQAIWSLSHPMGWTWEFNLASGQWHRRQSLGMHQWRGAFACNFHDAWLVQDLLHGGVCEVDPHSFTEDDEKITWMIESGALRDFPVSVRIPSIDFDFITAIGGNQLAEYDPSVQISWSHDGGETWSNPLIRGLGTEGKYGQRVTVRNIGRSTHQGTRLRLVTTDPTEITFRGATAVQLFPSRQKHVGVQP